MTQAFTSPITSRLKGGLFNPLEFNPYLLFDAQTSMLGELEAPTLDLDASDESTLDVITATRAGVATYTDLHGTIKTASADTVRVDWSLGYPAMLIEPSATNLITYSSSNQLNFALDNVSMTYNATGSPDGDTNGILFEQTGNNANNSAYNYSTLPTTDGDYCYSVFIKAADSTNIRFRHDNGVAETQDFNPQEMTSGTVAGGLNLKFEDVGNGWFRVSFTRSLSSAPYHRFQIYPDRNNTQKGVYIFGLQVELGSVATSYIPTSGSTVTRASDNLVIDGTAFSDFYNGSEGTFYVESQTKIYTAYIFQASSSSGNPYDNRHVGYYTSNNSLSIVSRTGNILQYSKTSVASGLKDELTRLAFSYKQSDFRVSFNGEAEPTPVGSQTPATTIDQIHLGDSHAGHYPLNGHIKRLIYWPTHSDSL